MYSCDEHLSNKYTHFKTIALSPFYRDISAMLCYVMLCYVLCYVMLCYVMLCYVMLCYVMLCYVMLCYVMSSVTEEVEFLPCHRSFRLAKSNNCSSMT